VKFPTISYIRGQGIRPVKNRGQNFLVDRNISRKTVAAADISPDDTIIEIGPGPGALTHFLAATGARVFCFEIDTGLYRILNRATIDDPNVNIINKNILDANFSDYITQSRNNIIVGSIPYAITTPILLKFLEYSDVFKNAVFIIQKEVAERLCAQPGKRDYGIFSVYCHSYLNAAIIQTIPAGCFYPPPKVDSAIIRMTAKTDKNWNSPGEKLFRELVRASFANRRKTLANSLKSFFHQKALNPDKFNARAEEKNISLKRRAETLSVEEFYTLTQIVEQMRPRD